MTAELKDIMQAVFDDSSMPDKLGIGRDYQQKEVFKYARLVVVGSTGWRCLALKLVPRALRAIAG